MPYAYALGNIQEQICHAESAENGLIPFAERLKIHGLCYCLFDSNDIKENYYIKLEYTHHHPHIRNAIAVKFDIR